MKQTANARRHHLLNAIRVWLERSKSNSEKGNIEKAHTALMKAIETLETLEALERDETNRIVATRVVDSETTRRNARLRSWLGIVGRYHGCA